MTSQTIDQAVTAFLRSHHQRARVFVRWHGGDAQTAASVWAHVQSVLEQRLPEAQMGQWLSLLWRTLVNAPAIKALGSQVQMTIPGLGHLGAGPRLMVLLRLIAGLDDAQAAEVLGISETSYRQVLQRHLPRLHDGQFDHESWRVLQERVQAELRGEPSRLPAPQPSRQPSKPAWQHEANAEHAAAPARWRTWGMALAASAMLVALGITFVPGLLHEAEPELPPGVLGQAEIKIEALPLPAQPPSPPADADAVMLADDGFALLAAGAPLPQLQDAAFDAWYAARLADEREAERAAQQAALDEALRAAEGDPAGMIQSDDGDL